MRALFVWFYLVALLSFARCEDVEGTAVKEESQEIKISNVVTLTVANFEHLTQATSGSTTGDWFVEFYAPWCGHCKKLTPIWEEIADTLKNEEDDSYVNIAKVDVPANRALGERFEVKGFPTLKMLSKGHIYTYKGKRAKEELLEWAKGGFKLQSPDGAVPPPTTFFTQVSTWVKSTPKLLSSLYTTTLNYCNSGYDFIVNNVFKKSPLKDENGNYTFQYEENSRVIILASQNFDALTKATEGTSGDWMVEFYAPWCGHCKSLAPIYTSVAEELKDETNIHVAKVDATAHRDLGTRFEIKGFPSIRMISKGKVYDYKGKRDKDHIIEWVKGGFMAQQPLSDAPSGGAYGLVKAIYSHAYKAALSDVKNSNYFSANLLVLVMPFLCFIVFVFQFCIPSSSKQVNKPVVTSNDNLGPKITKVE